MSDQTRRFNIQYITIQHREAPKCYTAFVNLPTSTNIHLNMPYQLVTSVVDASIQWQWVAQLFCAQCHLCSAQRSHDVNAQWLTWPNHIEYWWIIPRATSKFRNQERHQRNQMEIAKLKSNWSPFQFIPKGRHHPKLSRIWKGETALTSDWTIPEIRHWTWSPKNTRSNHIDSQDHKVCTMRFWGSLFFFTRLHKQR